MRFLATGGCGFLGSNLTAEILRSDDEFFIFGNLSREWAYLNLEWLQKQGRFKFYDSDIRSYNDVEKR
jgi:CDP-paratose 2-epimerase